MSNPSARSIINHMQDTLTSLGSGGLCRSGHMLQLCSWATSHPDSIPSFSPCFSKLGAYIYPYVHPHKVHGDHYVAVLSLSLSLTGIYINVRSSPLGSGTKIEQVEVVDVNQSIPYIQQIEQNVHQPRCTRQGEFGSSKTKSPTIKVH